jgi:hypothetical protein
MAVDGVVPFARAGAEPIILRHPDVVATAVR